jgi:hypothetical protein
MVFGNAVCMVCTVPSRIKHELRYAEQFRFNFKLVNLLLKLVKDQEPRTQTDFLYSMYSRCGQDPDYTYMYVQLI